MKFSTMRKETLLKHIARWDLQIPTPELQSTHYLRHRVSELFTTYLEDWFLRRIKQLIEQEVSWKDIRLPGRNYCHIPGSNLEFDFSWKSRRVAVEIQGGIDSSHRRSGHVSPAGMRRDMLKMCLAQHHGWILFQLAPEQITTCHLFHSQVAPWLIRALRRSD